MKKTLFAVLSVMAIFIFLGAGGQIGGGSLNGGGAVASVFGRTGIIVAATNDYTVAQVNGAAPIANPTFTGTAIAPILEFTSSIQKGVSTVHVTNQCTMTLAAAATTGTCLIAGGAAGNLCTWAASNASARALINDTTTAVAITAAGNIPFLTQSGTTSTLSFLTGGAGTFINSPVGTETFNVLCPI